MRPDSLGMLDINLHPFPVLNTERLQLRKIEASDAEAIYRLRSDERVMRYLDRPLAQSVKDAEDLVGRIEASLKNNEGITWAIAVKGNTTQLIGTIGFWRIDKENHRGEIGYLLNPGSQGKGLMSEAMKGVLAFGFNTLHLHSVEANVNPLNKDSIKLLEKNNFIREAWFRENYYYNGRFLDSLIYSLLAPANG